MWCGGGGLAGLLFVTTFMAKGKKRRKREAAANANEPG
eukprot:COSAG01_NODE_3327_length_6249_cov_73.923415_2_plen_37_part_01